MASNFKVGDVVELKSGGPTMTVNSEPMAGMPYYGCSWFAGSKLQTGHFNAEALKKAAPKKSS